MTRGPLSFKETDLMRALKTAKKAGKEVVGCEINPKTGNIVMHFGKADEQQPEIGNAWDKALS
jgi:hypothetical protein